MIEIKMLEGKEIKLEKVHFASAKEKRRIRWFKENK